MFRSVLNDPNEGKDEEVDREKINLNIDAINESMKKLFSKKEYESLEITSSDVDLMLKLMPTLSILEEGIRILGGENYCTGSSVLPFLVHFLRVLEERDEDPVFVTKLKKVLSDELIERCKKNLNFLVLGKASFLDKRYSKLGFLNKIEFPVGKTVTKEQIIAELELVSNENDSLSVSQPQESNKSLEPQSKKARFLASICDDDESVDDVGSKSNPQEEISRYLREKTLKPNDDPLLWWKRNRDIYPFLSQLAAKYLPIQATSTSAERMFSLLGNIITRKRTSMSDQTVNMLSFLSDCI